MNEDIGTMAGVIWQALEASGEDYNVYVPVMNALGALGKDEVRRNVLLRCVAALENHLKQVPEDARARILIGGHYAELDRNEQVLRAIGASIKIEED